MGNILPWTCPGCGEEGTFVHRIANGPALYHCHTLICFKHEHFVDGPPFEQEVNAVECHLLWQEENGKPKQLLTATHDMDVVMDYVLKASTAYPNANFTLQVFRKGREVQQGEWLPLMELFAFKNVKQDK